MNNINSIQLIPVSAIKERQQVNIMKIKLKRVKIVNEDLKKKLTQERTPISNVALNVVDNCRTRPECFLNSNDNSNIQNPYTEKTHLQEARATKAPINSGSESDTGCCTIM